MRKNLNRLATLALSGMMVMSMAVPAMAAQNFDSPVIKKVLYTDGNTYAPNTTFKFKAVWDADTTSFNEGGQNLTLDKLDPANAETAVSVANIKFDPAVDKLGDEFDAHGRVFRKQAAITVDTSKFPGAGYYLFNLTEVDGKYQGIRYDANTYKVFVIIYKDGETLKSRVTVYRADAQGKAKAKTESIGNNYGRETPPPETPENPPVTPPNTPENPPITPDTPDNDIHDILIKKNVTGDMANKSMDFEFEISIKANEDASREGHEYYKITGEGVQGGVGYLESDTPNQVFKLRHEGEGIRIYGLSNGDMITVKEKNGASYKMTVGVADKSKVDDGLFTDEHKTAYKDIVNYTTSEFAAIHNGAQMTVNNDKSSVTPTGIVMNVAPYAMMLAVAGGLGVVFMNRKKEEE